RPLIHDWLTCWLGPEITRKPSKLGAMKLSPTAFMVKSTLRRSLIPRRSLLTLASNSTCARADCAMSNKNIASFFILPIFFCFNRTYLHLFRIHLVLDLLLLIIYSIEHVLQPVFRNPALWLRLRLILVLIRLVLLIFLILILVLVLVLLLILFFLLLVLVFLILVLIFVLILLVFRIFLFIVALAFRRRVVFQELLGECVVVPRFLV